MTRPIPRSGSPYDVERLRHVAPDDWTNPEPAELYDLVVIGAGSGGLVTAAGAAGLGARVALVEAAEMGGDCLNVGCVPSKGLISAARVAAAARSAGTYGITAPDVTVEFARVMERMRSIRAEISPVDGAARFQNELGVDVFLGRGRFVKDGRVDVAGQHLNWRRAVIATGARAALPPVDGLAESGPLTNETVFDLVEAPGRLFVIGAGPIGCELAQAFARLGSKVTLADISERVLPREDPEAAELITNQLRVDGVNLVLGSQIKKVNCRGETRTIVLDGGNGEQAIEADHILVAAGRIPNVDDLGLEYVQVDYDHRTGVVVNDRLQTSNPKIFAVGDVAVPYQFTHMADATARIVIQNALFFGRKKWTDLVVPWVTYTEPEVAHVGISKAEASSNGIEIDEYRVDLNDVDRAMLDGEREGYVSILTEKGRDRILGATIVASHAGEMIGEVTTAMTHGIGLGGLGSVIHPYPTQAEAVRKAADAYSRTRLTPFAARLLAFLIKLRRRL